MSPAQITAHVGRVGAMTLSAPVVAGVVVGEAGYAAGGKWPQAMAMTLVSWLVQLFVIAVGVCSATALTGDLLVELHEATPTGFRMVQFVRAALVMASGLVGALLMFVPLHLGHVWPNDEGWVSLFAPAGAVVIVTVVGLLAAAFVRARPRLPRWPWLRAGFSYLWCGTPTCCPWSPSGAFRCWSARA